LIQKIGGVVVEMQCAEKLKPNAEAILRVKNVHHRKTDGISRFPIFAYV